MRSYKTKRRSYKKKSKTKLSLRKKSNYLKYKKSKLRSKSKRKVYKKSKLLRGGNILDRFNLSKIYNERKFNQLKKKEEEEEQERIKEKRKELKQYIGYRGNNNDDYEDQDQMHEFDPSRY